MILRSLVTARYSILGIVENDVCEADSFISDGEDDEKACRNGLRMKLRYIADNGLHGVSDKWSHEVDKKNQIYELIHGVLRLFYFKGVNGQIAICTGGVRKKGRKADPKCVGKAIRMKRDYFFAVESRTLTQEEES